MQISILLPTYRRPHQLREALASLAEQDPALIGEILVGDDSPAPSRADNVLVIASSPVADKVVHLPNDPPKGNYPNQWALGDAARFGHVLILHDDDHLCPGALARLAAACNHEPDERVKIWFGRNLIMDEQGRVDPARSAADTAAYGKDGPEASKPVWEWCLSHALPPNGALMARDTYRALMRGERDGNVGDFGLAVRLANSGAWGHFIPEDISRYRVQTQSNTNAGRGVDAHYMYELAQQLAVPAQGQAARARLLGLFAEVATARYLRDGERARAWASFLSPHWTWRRRLSPRGLATLAMLVTPAPAWRWALRTG